MAGEKFYSVQIIGKCIYKAPLLWHNLMVCLIISPPSPHVQQPLPINFPQKSPHLRGGDTMVNEGLHKTLSS